MVDPGATLTYSQGGLNDPIAEVLYGAITSKASDVHFEPEQDRLNVRFRVDGLLQLNKTFDKNYQENLISRIKILAKLDITNQRLPQDGHFEFKAQDRLYNVRVSTLPSFHGEAVVCRILNKGDILIGLEHLGFSQEEAALMQKIVASPSGLILSTGPTGSGKTTLLYSILNHHNKPDKNIITLEDPIEVQMPNVNQVNINNEIEMTFPRAMRAVLRQDPDIIMIGEIRDADTAQMAIQAALSGTIVLSTFHTFDVPALTVRFMEMGVSNSIIAQALCAVISTRLMRKVCNSCAREYQLADYEKKVLENNIEGGVYKMGKGCIACHYTGYQGRMGVFEIVFIDEEIRSAIMEGKPSVIYEKLRQKQIKSLKQSALEKVHQGVSTVNEYIRILGFNLSASSHPTVQTTLNSPQQTEQQPDSNKLPS